MDYFDWLNETTEGGSVTSESGFNILNVGDEVVKVGNSALNFLQTTAIVCAVICIMIIGIMIGFKHSSESFQEGKAWLFDILLAILGVFATTSLVTCVVAFCL